MSKTIRSVRIYQAVSFEKANETTFIVKGTQRKKPVSIKLNKELHGVDIESSRDSIFVPMTNISCIHFDCLDSKEKEDSDKANEKQVKENKANFKDSTKKPK